MAHERNQGDRLTTIGRLPYHVAGPPQTLRVESPQVRLIFRYNDRRNHRTAHTLRSDGTQSNEGHVCSKSRLPCPSSNAAANADSITGT